MEQTTDGITTLGFTASNAYLVGAANSDAWVIVDSGLPGHFEAIKDTAVARFGSESRPAAILLTHGHIDHYGSALALAAYWNTPVYAHPLDLPYLTGRATLPPADPTVGGFFAQLSRAIPVSGTDFGDFVHPLPEDGSVPGLPDWEWVHTPGHTPGHVSLFRKSDQTLIAGDAILTVDLDNAPDTIKKVQKLARPVTALTYDWLEARKSLQKLAALKPLTIASGHGIPMHGETLAGKLQAFADDFLPPLSGRYVAEPAEFDENGVTYLPPAPTDMLPKIAIGVGVAAAVAVGVYVAMSRQRERKNG